MNNEEEKYRLTSHWAEFFLQEIERKLDAAVGHETQSEPSS